MSSGTRTLPSSGPSPTTTSSCATVCRSSVLLLGWQLRGTATAGHLLLEARQQLFSFRNGHRRQLVEAIHEPPVVSPSSRPNARRTLIHHGRHRVFGLVEMSARKRPRHMAAQRVPFVSARRLSASGRPCLTANTPARGPGDLSSPPYRPPRTHRHATRFGSLTCRNPASSTSARSPQASAAAPRSSPRTPQQRHLLAAPSTTPSSSTRTTRKR